MRRLTDDELAEYDELKPKDDTWDMLAWIFIVLLVGCALGYTWRYVQEPSTYERGYVAGMEELSVVTRAEVCP